MKKTFKSITAIFMIVLTIFSCCSVALAAKPKAEIEVVYDDNGNRVGDLALSAIGTGSCPKDEGFFHDEAAAPAVAYRT